MHEAGLTQIMDRVSEHIATKRVRGTPMRKLDGKIGRIDSFMGRVVPNENPDHREYLLIELKKPSIKIGRKETDQVEDYVNAILAQPDFINTSTQWNFYLVTSEYDDATRQRITQENRPMGLFIDKPNHKVWVKSWAELIRDCETRLKFVQDKLRIEVSAEEIQERIAILKASVLKSDIVEKVEPIKPPVQRQPKTPMKKPLGKKK
jgi:hypothetical protein